MDARLEELLDKQAIEEVAMRYSRTLDWLDAEGQGSCYWPDAEINYGFYEGDGAGWVPVVMEVELGTQRRWHLCGGLLIAVDGPRASSECYGFTVSCSENEAGEKVDSLFGGRYMDEWEKRDGEWRILKRQYILDFAYQLPNGLDELARSGLNLPILQIQQAGHPAYRPL
ncbi:MAG: nuclear transport factor 2 family protein [Halieaceae bacterium]|jgi:hypothetical protein|nr:nuclear transport factor 2 family protein [Halieaceae bacterium]